jgi:hypothetical protein
MVSGCSREAYRENFRFRMIRWAGTEPSSSDCGIAIAASIVPAQIPEPMMALGLLLSSTRVSKYQFDG